MINFCRFTSQIAKKRINRNLITRFFHNLNGFLFKFQEILSYLLDTSDLTEEQISISQIAYEFAQTKILPFAPEWDQKHYFPADVMREAAQLGFASIYTSSEYGGCNLGRLEASLIMEGLATGCASTAAYISIHNMCSWMIDSYGTKEQKEKYLPRLNTMEILSSYCLTEPNSGSDAAGMKTFAKKVGEYYVINGSKTFISGGSFTDLYILMCLTGENEISTILVDKGTPGLSFGKREEKLGWNNQPTTMVLFEECKVPVTNLIGKQGQGFKFAMKALDGGRINIASCSLGGAAQCLEQAKNYIKERKQFGKPLSEFQYLQFKLADMATDLVSSRLLVRKAARMMDLDHPDQTMYSAMAKRYATDKCFEIVDYALQMHGGYGYLKEYPIERYLRDLRVHRILEGTNEIMRLIISRKILKDGK